MENLIISYIVKASLAMTLLYALYILCFRNDTFNKGRRFYLLFILLFSVVYPFCKFEMSTAPNIAIYEAILPQIEITQNIADASSQSFGLVVINVLLFILVTGVLILFFRLFTQLATIVSLRFKNRSEYHQNYKLIILNKDINLFSFFHWIFISTNQCTEDELNIMIAHEKEHVNQGHSFDIILSELFCILFWWNPIAWLLKKEIKMNLEYLADKGVLEKGIESRKYQYLLLQVIKESATIQIVNNFNVSQLKKRITMINKKKTSRLMSFKYLLIVPVIGLMLVWNTQSVFSQQIESTPKISVHSTTSGEELKPFVSVEKMPMFPGGNKAMMEYVNTNLKYPESAKSAKIEGRVVVRFIVSKLGEVKDVKIVRSLEASCDEEAMRVVREMPTWTPGKQNGKDVDVYYTLPILYKLEKDTPKTTSN